MVTVAEKTTKMAHKLSGVGPDVPVDDGFDQGYFFISLNWVYSGGSFDCGYMYEETESTTGPATGNMQGELHVTQKVANQYIIYNPWNFDQDFVNGLGQESGCYAYETNSYWLGEGAGALQWPDGNQDASGNQYVDGDQP